MTTDLLHHWRKMISNNKQVYATLAALNYKGIERKMSNQQ